MRLTEPQYLEVLRDELSDFRESFKEWIAGWDRYNDIEDEWGFEHLLQ